MNVKGQMSLYSLMIGILLIVFGIAVAPAVKDFTAVYRGNSTSETVALDCNNSSISDYNKGACVITDFNQAYIILGIIGIGLTFIGVGALMKKNE